MGHSNIDREEVTQIISTHDITKDGQVSFIEFKKIFEENELNDQDSPLIFPVTPLLTL